ncbi:MAG: hypothetical protein AB7Q23_14645 [Hyphomonadaceae bacterium]
MTARRSTSDPVSHDLQTGERVVWRHQPAPRVLFYNRLPGALLALAMSAFVMWIGWSIAGAALPRATPAHLDLWTLLGFVPAIFFAVLVLFFLIALWGHAAALHDSWSTHYALTGRRFVVVSRRGVIEYDAPYFWKMEALGGAPGEQVLLFDWGLARRGREYFRARIAALPDAKKLEHLIRATLKP